MDTWVIYRTVPPCGGTHDCYIICEKKLICQYDNDKKYSLFDKTADFPINHNVFRSLYCQKIKSNL